jgi:hypothetical protein
MESFRQMIEAVQLLALDPADQEKAFPEYTDAADELVITYCYQYEVVAKKLSAEYGLVVASTLKDIYDKFDSKKGVIDFYTSTSLHSSEEWTAIRTKAREVLQLLQLPLTKPSLDWVSYIPSKQDK